MKLNKFILTVIVCIFSTFIACAQDFDTGKMSNLKQKSKQSKAKSAVNNPTLSEPDGYINGHGFVDLGLPSGTKWATCNVGACEPEEYGDLFAWGECKPKSSYTEGNSLTYNKPIDKLKSEGIFNSNGTLTKSHDAAISNWGESWRMPTKKDFEELKNKCIWVWTKRAGNNGYKIIGPSGKSIFLPALGLYLNFKPDCSYYWSSSASSSDKYANTLYFNNSTVSPMDMYLRCYGLTIRPVVESEQTSNVESLPMTTNGAKSNLGENVSITNGINPSGYINGHAYVDLGLPSGLKWATCNVGAESQEKYGDYFAWGETTMKENYKENNSFTRNKTISTMQTLRIINESGILNESYDAANVNWGSSWRMPTEKEFEELKVKCKWQWIEMGGEYGYKITGPNKKSIFLPAAGFAIHNFIRLSKECGYYWSSSVEEGNNASYMIGFDAIGSPNISWNLRDQGCPVRPVSF